MAPGTKLSSVGCGGGEMLAHLRSHRHCTGYGIELDDAKVLECVKRGVNVVQRNLEDGLSIFEDDSFDLVLQLDTLQHLRNAETMLRETARVGRSAIVSFPNFAHWPNRLAVLRGRMPVTKTLPYQWYDTPNIRVGTFADFEVLALRNGLKILDSFGLHDGQAAEAILEHASDLERTALVGIHTRGVPFAQRLRREIETHGPIKHLIAPNSAHWVFLDEWQQACPEATLWAAPGLRERAQVHARILEHGEDVVRIERTVHERFARAHYPARDVYNADAAHALPAPTTARPCSVRQTAIRPAATPAWGACSTASSSCALPTPTTATSTSIRSAAACSSSRSC